MSTLEVRLKQKILKNLPQFKDYSTSKLKIKNWKYFVNKGNRWNNPSRIQAKKIYQYYHGVNESAKPILDHIKKMQVKDRKIRQVRNVTKVLHRRKQTQANLYRRKNERISLQSSCMQSICKKDTSLLESTIKVNGLHDTLRISEFYNFKNKNLNRWQNPHRSSTKILKLTLRPTVLKGDHVALTNISRRIQEERIVEDYEATIKKKKVKKIRNTFIKQHQANHAWERKVGLVPPPNKRKLERAQTTLTQKRKRLKSNQFNKRPNTTHQSFNLKFSPYLMGYTHSRSTNRLSMPKLKKYFQNNEDVNPYMHTEFNGLILTSINENSLRNKSKYAKVVFNMSRKAQRQLAKQRLRPRTYGAKNANRSKSDLFAEESPDQQAKRSKNLQTYKKANVRSESQVHQPIFRKYFQQTFYDIDQFDKKLSDTFNTRRNTNSHIETKNKNNKSYAARPKTNQVSKRSRIKKR